MAFDSISIQQLSDATLLTDTARILERDRQTTAELLAHLAELETRKLYLGASCSSLFTYCTQVLHISEPAAYSRITAARAARRFPVILGLLADGSVNLTTITLLAKHLTDDNYETLLEAATHKSKRDVERLVAAIDPQPDVASSVRRAPAPVASVPAPAPAAMPQPTEPIASGPALPAAGQESRAEPLPPMSLRTSHRRAVVAPIGPERYLVKITIGAETHAKLERARDLLRHTIPNGDPAAIVDRALTVLVDQLERTRRAATSKPRSHRLTASASRHVPAAVKRVVWARDERRCAFVGSEGRCAETGFLQIHHLVPFAARGATSIDNLQLRCRAHNAYEAERWFGRSAPLRKRAPKQTDSVRPELMSVSDATAQSPLSVRSPGSTDHATRQGRGTPEKTRSKPQRRRGD